MKYIVYCVTFLFSFALQAQAPDPFYSDFNPYFKVNVGECTWYVWGRVYTNDRIKLPAWGSAGTWFGSASSKYQTGTTPKAHSIAVWVNSGQGHVAYVEKFEGGLVYFSQANIHGKAENDGISSLKPEEMKNQNGKLPGATVHYIYLDNSQNPKGNAAMPAPVLTIVPTIIRPIGTFTVDLYGDYFQSDARVFAQKFVQGDKNPNWYSPDIIVKSMGSKHLQATLSATAPFEFTISVRNPDMQISASQTIKVVAGSNAAPTPKPTPSINSSSNNAIHPADNKLPQLYLPSGESISLKAGEVTQLTGENFVQGSRVVLLQQAPGTPELILANLNADAKGTIQWNYQSTCDSKTGKYVIRALDQPTPGAVPGTKSNSVTINIDSKSSNCSSILGIKKAQASNQGGVSAQAASGVGAGPALDSLSPTNHPPGQFGIDLYGNGFQQGAKVVAQGSDWNSDKAAVTFLGPNHLRAIIVASNPGQFAVTVRNPDGQMSTSRSFDVTVSNIPVSKGAVPTAPKVQPIGNNSNSTITIAPNPGSNGISAKPPSSSVADSKPANSSVGPTVPSPGGLQSPLSNSASRVASPNPPTSTVPDTSSKKQVSNSPPSRSPIGVTTPQSPNYGSGNAVQRINIPSNTHSAEQAGWPPKNTQARPMVTNGQQPPVVLPRNSGQTLPTGAHNQTVSGQPVPTAIHPEPKRQDIPKPQASPQYSGTTPIIHPPTPVPPTNKPGTSQNTQLPRGPAPTMNMPQPLSRPMPAPVPPTNNRPPAVQNTQLPRGPSPTANTPPPRPMPPSPQPSSSPANQKPAPAPTKTPGQSQSNDKRKP